MTYERSPHDMPIAFETAIHHPQADTVSVAIGALADCNFPRSVDLLIIKDGEVVNEPLPEFAAYWTEYGYSYVHLHVFADFLKAYG